MPKIPHCQFNHLAIRHTLRAVPVAGPERLIGWGAAARETSGAGVVMQIALALLPGIGDIAALIFDNKQRLLLVLTDQRLLLCSTTSPIVGPYPDVGPVAIDLGNLEVASQDEAGAFRIANTVEDVAEMEISFSLKIDLNDKPGTPQAKLNRGLLLLAGGAPDAEEGRGGSGETMPDPHGEPWEPRPSRWD